MMLKWRIVIIVMSVSCSLAFIKNFDGRSNNYYSRLRRSSRRCMSIFRDDGDIIKDQERFGKQFSRLRWARITKETKQPFLFIGPESSDSQNSLSITKYFVAGSIVIWAVGYSGVFISSLQAQKLNESSDYYALGLAGLLIAAFFIAAGKEQEKTE